MNDADRVEAVKQDWRAAGLSPREQALCTYAEKLTLEPQEMSPDDLIPLKEVGLDDAAILDLAQVTSYFNYINRMADGLGVDLEPFMRRP
ncbi:MAG: peroxidase [Planctomycetes bacterium]|nr:peroxidase [Planctomycetota bacterium]